MNTTQNRMIRGFLVAATMSVVFIVAVTVAGELSAPLKDWLKQTFYHHWLGKGILAWILFTAAGIVFSLVFPSDGRAIARGIKTLSWASVLGALALLAFFAAEYFHLL